MSKRKKPPVPTRHDDRAEEKRERPAGPGEAKAPDGVSGNWS